MKRDPKKTWRNKCDALVTPIAKKLKPKCEGCGQPTEVGHHWIEKSRSSYLRYDVERNIISLCTSCHAKIHNRFGNSVVGGFDIADKVIKQRGKKWKNQLDKDSTKMIKVDLAHYQESYAHLKSLLDN